MNIDHNREEKFHDDWAKSADLRNIDVVQVNEALTSPELRYIHKTLGDIREKQILDFGCGLGEVAVYFALKGGKVTAVDLSQEMLHAAQALAVKNNTQISVVKAQADLKLQKFEHKFDIIYLGNLLHHVNIDETLSVLKTWLKPEGIFVSWDPIEYNPIINIYRWMAKEVRTPDEHPLTVADLKTFKKHFALVECKPFWLTTLVVFILMFVFGSNPNKERFWKKVISEEKKWAPLYLFFEKLDQIVLSIFGRWLWPLCWNLVVISRLPS